MSSRTFCIVGGGMAGGRAAARLRELGFDGRLVLVSKERELPYERPPLSKAYLLGKLGGARLFLQPATFYAEHDVEWHPETEVTAIDLPRSELSLGQGERIAFDRLLLATGSRPLRLPLPGADLEGVVTYRSLADADRLIAALQGSPKVAVIGGGFLGTELAAACRRLGSPVTMIEVGPRLLGQLGDRASDYCTRLHLEQGVEVLTGAQVARFRGRRRLEAVELDGGRRVSCDLALVCVGVRAESALAERAGLAVDPGVVVDASCRTADERVLAAGDVASFWSPRWQRRLHIEHYDNAHLQGLAAAAAMLGDPATYDPVPYFWTEQYQGMVQQVGLLSERQLEVVRGEPESGRFSVFHLQQGRLRGCVAVNRYPDLAAARRLIAAGIQVDPAQLADLDFDLRGWSQEVAEAAAPPSG